MRALAVLCAIAAAAIAGARPASAAPVPQAAGAEVVADVRVHGNTMASEADVLAITAIRIGAPFSAQLVDETRARLLASGRFDGVEVLKRYASIADPSRILVMIIVNEPPARVATSTVPGELPRLVPRRGIRNLMLLPILDAEDGYGLTYGAQLAFVRVGGSRGRVMLPLSWGGTKQAGAVFERTFGSGPLSRLQVGLGITRRTNPAYREMDERRRVWTRAERRLGSWNVGATLSRERSAFASSIDHVTSLGADVTLDTRVDPFLARNAVYLHSAWTRVRLSRDASVTRGRVDARGYLGVFRQVVLVARVEHDSASRALPPYLQPMLGGWSNLRGFRTGSFVGDQRVAGSLELRVPLSSALSVGRVGISVFIDAGSSYDVGEHVREQSLERGAGAAAWVSATAFRFALSVARGRGAGTRVNFSMGYGF